MIESNEEEGTGLRVLKKKNYLRVMKKNKEGRLLESNKDEEEGTCSDVGVVARGVEEDVCQALEEKVLSRRERVREDYPLGRDPLGGVSLEVEGSGIRGRDHRTQKASDWKVT